MQNISTLKQTGIALAIAQAVAVNVSFAATITVDNNGDADSGCTFREAITTINQGSNQFNGCSIQGTLGNNDVVQFDNSLSAISLTSGSVLVSSDMSINPDGGGVAIVGNRTDRLLEITNANVSIDRVTLLGGSVNSYGGRIYARTSSVAVTNSTIAGNIATTGGGIHVNSSTVSVVNSTISGNSTNNSLGFGGGIAVFGGTSSLELTNSTITGNSSDGDGGGLSAFGARQVSLRNSLVSGNSAGSIYRGNELYLYGNTIVSLRNNLLGDSSQTTERAFYGTQPSSTINIIATSNGNTPTPIASILAPFGNNGGPTQTHGLVENSPAIDAGDDLICAEAQVNNLDQRGVPRPVGPSCDIGSFEGVVEPQAQSDSDLFVVPLPNGNAVIFSL